jgi:hypothetical protein
MRARRFLPSPTLRLAACLILGAITVDLLADTRCDAPSSFPASTKVMREPGQREGGTGEPCAPVCIPDCFCCSRSVAPDAAVLPPEPEPLTHFDAPATERWPEGVRPVVDHPPLARG